MAERNPRLDQLDPLAGTWDTDITMLEADGSKGDKFRAVDRYEWMPGKHFMLHHVEANMPHGEVAALEVLGLKDDASGFFIHSYDSDGGYATFDATVESPRYSAVGTDIRFDGEYGSGNQTVAGRWHRREAEQWVPWMDVVLTRRD
jgi:hypothetical protein